MPNEPSHRILVVANETASSAVLGDVVASLAGPAGARADVLVVAPALSSRLAYWSSDEARARRGAELRLARCLELLAAAGVEAEGAVGDSDPLLAIEDALRLFDADQIVIATHPEAKSNWLAHGIVERTRRRFELPLRHVVVDLAQEREYVVAA